MTFTVISQKVMILVAEPWDFTSPEGNNKFSGRIIDKTFFNRTRDIKKPRFEDAFLIKVNVPFITDGLLVNYIVAEYRNKKADSEGFNRYYSR